MARPKIPENETVEDTYERKCKEAVSGNATRSEKTSWNRKYDNITKMIEDLEPIEFQILDLMAMKQERMDKITLLRKEMLDSCVHPFDQLVLHNDAITCKFCEKRFSAVNVER